ncbi:hypothetical protein [Effusibacillus dendaii]|uniref:Uncharacterized protein n=1 Tax=Effusibacillus dendaii TaxID=2743772 RepID=A0A7I8DCL0_9BACL|nr:hypothetical protein [Effusibacillus dendaii]BCJ86566.1 hypothetical protein skT53_15510 [Effusibacillus dendaii]
MCSARQLQCNRLSGPVPVPIGVDETAVIEKIGRPLSESDLIGTIQGQKVAPQTPFLQNRIRTDGQPFELTSGVTAYKWEHAGVRCQLQTRSSDSKQTAELLNCLREWENLRRSTGYLF